MRERYLNKFIKLTLKKKACLLTLLPLMAAAMDAAAENTNFSSSSAFYNTSNIASSSRVLANAAAISGTLGVFGGDAMVPVWGNNQNGFAYGDLIGQYGTDGTYLVSPGAGYRHVMANQIVGAYLFGDYEQVSQGQNFWVISPGLEWMNPQWDAHLNGYFPTTTAKQNGDTAFLDTFGDYSQVSFETGTHNQYDELVTPYDVIGNGGDAEVGFSFAGIQDDLRSRVYVGGYFYLPPGTDEVDNITGVTGGFEQAITENLKLSVFNSYDQVTDYHVGASLTLVFGGESNTFSNDVHTRLLDPVERHVGIVDTGAGTYDQQDYKDAGIALEYDDVYFMDPESVGYSSTPDGDGTYGNPMELTQTSLDAINVESSDGAHIYLQGGADAVYYVNSSTATASGDQLIDGNLGLYVYNGQDFYGRSTDYTAPAATNEQPLIMVDTVSSYNGFIAQGGENTFSDLNISSNASGTNKGILFYNAESDDAELTINNTSVSQFSIGVYAENSSTGNLTVSTNNSQFNDNLSTGQYANAYGMQVVNAGSGNVLVNVTDSQFNDNTVTQSGVLHSAVGLYVQNESTGNLTVNANHSEFNGNTSEGPASSSIGLRASNDDTGRLTINANSSTFNNNIASGGDAPLAAGLYVANQGSGVLSVSLSNSQFNNNSSDGPNSYAFGAELINNGSGNFMITAVDSQFNNNLVNTDTGTQGSGMYAGNNSTGDLRITAINSQFNNNDLVGLYVSNGSTGVLSVDSLYGSSFNNNIMGIYGSSTYFGYTTINYSGASFSGNVDNINTDGNVILF